MEERSEFDLGLEQGLRIGRVEGSLFAGLPRVGTLPGARFAFRRSLFDSFADYERAIVDNLREIQRLRWLQEHPLAEPAAPVPIGAREPSLTELEETAKRDLWLVREAVDAERAEGRGRSCVVAALRAKPQTPGSVREFSPAEFAAEDPRRVAVGDVERAELVGEDYGHHWGLEDPLRRWQVGRWRIVWLCGIPGPSYWDRQAPIDEGGSATAEVAAELVGEAGERRVWLLGTIRSRAALDEALEELKRHAIGERNSLVAAAESVARVSRDEGWA